MKTFYLAIILGVSLIAGCSFFVSGNFILDKDSPLPIWFENTNQIPREKTRVKITIYEAYHGVPGKIKIKIYGPNDKKLAKSTGTWQWHPISLKKIKEGNAEEPIWTIVKVKGTSEIYEQSEQNNILKIVDAPPKDK